jgi:hypothetical protein
VAAGLNKCAACQSRALLVRRHGRLDYRCPNRSCAERPRTQSHQDTPFDVDLARVEWNDLNPAACGIVWAGKLESMLGRRATAIIRSTEVTVSVTGELGFNNDCYLVCAPGAVVEFAASAVQTIDDSRIVVKEKPRQSRRGLVS